MMAARVFLLACFVSLSIAPSNGDELSEALGFRTDTVVLPNTGEGDFCPGTVLQQHDDDSFENGYAWRFAGVVPPDYGSWAECYESDFVCGVEFLLTQTGYYVGQTMDVYVWEWDDDGNPPPGPDPGNVICMLTGVAPGPIAMWPEISVHDIRVCCPTGGAHFVGYWPNWPGAPAAWYVASDENGPGGGCPRMKIAPGIGYPTGWSELDIMPTFEDCKALGIREYAGLGDCQATPTEKTTWGSIKALH
jgi:hypothetical protein